MKKFKLIKNIYCTKHTAYTIHKLQFFKKKSSGADIQRLFCIKNAIRIYLSRYKPSDLEEISEQTKFTKSEVKFLYRAFKTECPNGIIDEDTFKEVYEKIFPLGDASKYAMIVFRAIDKEKTGGITFGDFMDFLSVITKGTDHQKILWSFQFFDVNQDGKITREEMIKVKQTSLKGAIISAL